MYKYLSCFLNFAVNIDQNPDEKDCPSNMSEICNKALDGIVLITTADGDIVFISENVSSYLGLSQVIVQKNYVCFYTYMFNSEITFINIVRSIK